jgi:hypothetical protein
MKKIIIATITALALTACGSKTIYVTNTEAPETTVKVVKTTDAPIATAAPAPVYTTEDEFIYDINTSYDNVIYLEDQDMIDAGYATCDALRSGSSAYETLSAIASSADGDPDIEQLLTSVVASAIINFCPEQQYKFDN